MIINNLIFVMTLSGSIVFILYLIIYPLAKRCFEVQWRYFILKMSLFFYLVPIHYFKYFLPLPGRADLFLMPMESQKLKVDHAIAVGLNSIYVSNNIKKMWLLMAVFSMISLMVIIHQIIHYVMSRRNIKELMELTDGIHDEQITHIKEKLNIRGIIELRIVESLDTPMLIGIISPVILIPDFLKKKINSDEWQDILSHELLHVKSRDLLIKLISMIVIAVHWYNPLSYLLFWEICNISEVCCDYRVVKDMNEERKRRYYNLIIDLATDHNKGNQHALWSVLFSFNKKIIKRRTMEMKLFKLKKKKIASWLAAVGISLISASTVYAYEAPLEVVLHNSNKFSFEEEYIFVAGMNVENGQNILPYDMFFTDHNGVVHDYSIIGDSKAICFHDYISGTITKHYKDSDGGCKVEYYNADRCRKCGKTNIYDCYNTETNTLCPH